MHIKQPLCVFHMLSVIDMNAYGGIHIWGEQQACQRVCYELGWNKCMIDIVCVCRVIVVLDSSLVHS